MSSLGWAAAAAAAALLRFTFFHRPTGVEPFRLPTQLCLTTLLTTCTTHSSHPTFFSIFRGISSYFYPFQYTNATTSWEFFQSITVELGMITAKYIYTCAPVNVLSAECVASPLTFTGLYPRFFTFWYREINSSGYSPYDNTPIPTSDPALASLCLCALAMGFAVASIVVTSANAAAMKREILDLPPYDKSMLVFKGCRYCPPPGHTYTVQRGVLFNSLALAAQVSG